MSKGMQQKVQFIAALLHEPELIIMDEPFSGLDPVNANVLKDVILELKEQGRTILFSTHRMDQVEKLCDSICLINHGRAVLQGGLREIKASYGSRFVQIAFEGDGKFLARCSLVESSNNYGNYAEVKLRRGRRLAGTAPRRDVRSEDFQIRSDGTVARANLHRPGREASCLGTRFAIPGSSASMNASSGFAPAHF